MVTCSLCKQQGHNKRTCGRNLYECPICMDPVENTNNCVLSCGHRFHMGCMLKALERNNSCPLCRSEVIQYQYNSKEKIENSLEILDENLVWITDNQRNWWNSTRSYLASRIN